MRLCRANRITGISCLFVFFFFFFFFLFLFVVVFFFFSYVYIYIYIYSNPRQLYVYYNNIACIIQIEKVLSDNLLVYLENRNYNDFWSIFGWVKDKYKRIIFGYWNKYKWNYSVKGHNNVAQLIRGNERRNDYQWQALRHKSRNKEWSIAEKNITFFLGIEPGPPG